MAGILAERTAIMSVTMLQLKAQVGAAVQAACLSDNESYCCTELKPGVWSSEVYYMPPGNSTPSGSFPPGWYASARITDKNGRCCTIMRGHADTEKRMGSRSIALHRLGLAIRDAVVHGTENWWDRPEAAAVGVARKRRAIKQGESHRFQ
jgi:hypothetical protein